MSIVHQEALQVPEVKEKVAQTNLEKYGCINVSQNKEIQNKVKETKDNWTDEQRQEVSNKISKKVKAYWENMDEEEYSARLKQMSDTSKKWWSEMSDEWKVDWNSKNKSNGSYGVSTKFIFPNKKFIVTRSFWESIFMLYLYYNKVAFSYEQLCIPYILEDKKCSYFPDFYIEEFNYVIEIKGNNIHPDKLIEQEKAVLKTGYNYEIIWGIEPFKQWLENNTKINLEKLYKRSKEALQNNKLFSYKLRAII